MATMMFDNGMRGMEEDAALQGSADMSAPSAEETSRPASDTAMDEVSTPPLGPSPESGMRPRNPRRRLSNTHVRSAPGERTSSASSSASPAAAAAAAAAAALEWQQSSKAVRTR
eukprot:scaffold3938_cov110-Pinguiococcus_pyrenoidosus.AAC.1